jgi:ribosomal-protein-alanine N-acetyltransferase
VRTSSGVDNHGRIAQKGAVPHVSKTVNLIAISPSGAPAEEMSELPVVATEVGAAYVALYKSLGFVQPWLGYFGRQDPVCIGTCGFKGPPKNNRVEIAYFTFPGHEGRGYARRMALAPAAGPLRPHAIRHS